MAIAETDKQGLLDKLVDLFRSNPPEKVAEEMEKRLDKKPDDKVLEKPELDRENMPKPLYKGVSL